MPPRTQDFAQFGEISPRSDPLKKKQPAHETGGRIVTTRSGAREWKLTGPFSDISLGGFPRYLPRRKESPSGPGGVKGAGDAQATTVADAFVFGRKFCETVTGPRGGVNAVRRWPLSVRQALFDFRGISEFRRSRTLIQTETLYSSDTGLNSAGISAGCRLDLAVGRLLLLHPNCRQNSNRTPARATHAS